MNLPHSSYFISLNPSRTLHLVSLTHHSLLSSFVNLQQNFIIVHCQSRAALYCSLTDHPQIGWLLDLKSHSLSHISFPAEERVYLASPFIIIFHCSASSCSRYIILEPTMRVRFSNFLHSLQPHHISSWTDTRMNPLKPKLLLPSEFNIQLW